MKKIKPATIVRDIRTGVKKNAPALLTTFCVGSIFTTGVLSFKAGVKSADDLRDNKEAYDRAKRNDDKEKQRTIIFERAKIIGKNSWPAAVSGATGIASAVASNYISNKRITLLSAGLAVAERAIKENEEAIERAFGEDGNEKVRKAKAEKRYEDQPVNMTGEQIDAHFDSNHTYPCRISFDGTQFFSNAGDVREAINLVRSRMLGGQGFVSVNDFKEALGLRPTLACENFGWNYQDYVYVNSGDEYGCNVPIYFEAILGPGDRPVLSIEMDVSLKTDYKEYE